LILNFAVWVLASPPWGVKAIRALTVTLPVCLNFRLASLESRSGTVIVGGSPKALEGFRRSRRFFSFTFTDWVLGSSRSACR
jgi:hypothetical protein